MLIFSAKQMAAMQRARLENVVDQMVIYLRQQYPDAPPAAELRQALLPMLDQMSAWGICSGPFLALHILASKVLGLDYHTIPALSKVFTDPDITDELKEEWFSSWLTAVRHADLQSA